VKAQGLHIPSTKNKHTTQKLTSHQLGSAFKNQSRTLDIVEQFRYGHDIVVIEDERADENIGIAYGRREGGGGSNVGIGKYFFVCLVEVR
jgi:hypothetical protein